MDRNLEQLAEECSELGSLSARRAWIEILPVLRCGRNQAVALRKESVDRNINADIPRVCVEVALRKESVDRNDDKSLT